MIERDYKILVKILEYQNDLISYINEFSLSTAADVSKVHPAIRRGIVGFIADIFELTKPLSDPIKAELPLNNVVIKQFRNTSTHQYGVITDAMVFACLMHCTDKRFVEKMKELVIKRS